MKTAFLRRRALAAALIVFMCIAAIPLTGGPSAYAAALTGTGSIKTSNVNLRQAASTSSKSLGSLSRGTRVSIQREEFTKPKSAKAVNRWYYVTAGKKSGYVRADLVGSISYGGSPAVTTDAVNYRKGPATTFKKYGAVSKGTPVTLMIPAKRIGSGETWYKAVVNGKNSYLSSKYVNANAAAPVSSPVPAANLAGKSALAAALLSGPTYGGKARVVYTFDTKNCRKVCAVKGYSGISTPQGFAYNGSVFYILYGTAAGQRIVTYSNSGQRIAATRFAFGIGHPNGITWDPVTRLCYIFKGNGKRIYTWDPALNKFGKAKTPYSSSGVGYDSATNLIYASSHTGIRAYSADGSFSHKKLFPRCSHGIRHYIQDCGAGEGFIFHGISGSNKQKTNFLDIYRAADSAYLGSVKITIGEYESAVVGSDGYLYLLINTSDKTDYIWKTPLNVKELK